MRLHIPIRLQSLANTRMHWWAMARLKKQQRNATRLSLIGKPVPHLPVVVTITRIGPCKLDDDNLAAACKYVRDQIAEHIGVDDGSPLYTWVYKQRVTSMEQYGVDVEIVTWSEVCSGATESPSLAARGIRAG